MNEEKYEWFSVDPPQPHNIQTKKYIYEGLGRTTKYIRVDRPACCEPVFKHKTDQTLCFRKRLRDTSKFSPQNDKQGYKK